MFDLMYGKKKEELRPITPSGLVITRNQMLIITIEGASNEEVKEFAKRWQLAKKNKQTLFISRKVDINFVEDLR